MKIIFCRDCTDLLRLRTYDRECECGRSGGKYLADGLHAEIWGRGVPLGIGNDSFVDAVHNQKPEGYGVPFQAWVISKKCDTVEEI